LLAEARGLAARWGAELPGEVLAFITASCRAARSRRLRLAATTAGAVVALPVIAGLVWAGMVWWGVRQLEAEWAAKGEFVRIPAGCFKMGSPDNEPGRYPNEGPVHRVCVKSFDLAKHEVTQAAWRRIMVGLLSFPSSPDPSRFKGDDRPVEQVSWNEAQLFVRLMSFFGHGRYRLPSESEWEYAARAGTASWHYWGDDIDDGCTHANIADQSLKKVAPEIIPVFANCDDGYWITAPVGSFKPNPWGLSDMLGNVAEWVEDYYVDNYRDTPTDGTPNTAGPCTSRVVRGGSWNYGLRSDRAADRTDFAPESRFSNVGFRVARSFHLESFHLDPLSLSLLRCETGGQPCPAPCRSFGSR
jgi:formylglycine-generating enzyme